MIFFKIKLPRVTSIKLLDNKTNEKRINLGIFMTHSTYIAFIDIVGRRKNMLNIFIVFYETRYCLNMTQMIVFCS